MTDSKKGGMEEEKKEGARQARSRRQEWRKKKVLPSGSGIVLRTSVLKASHSVTELHQVAWNYYLGSVFPFQTTE